MDNNGMLVATATAAPKFRAYNRCKYDIGVVTADHRQYNIKPGSFALLTLDDIAYIESICQDKKFFGAGMLEVVDAAGKRLTFEQMSVVEAPEEEKVLTEDEITAALKKSLKQFTEWLDKIDDPVELHAIYTVASKMDLPSSKLKALSAKMPNKDWLEQME